MGSPKGSGPAHRRATTLIVIAALAVLAGGAALGVSVLVIRANDARDAALATADPRADATNAAAAHAKSEAAAAEVGSAAIALATIAGVVLVLTVHGGGRRRAAVVAEQRRAAGERAALLERNEEGFRHLFEANPQAMWVWDIETMRIVAVNDEAVRLYGWSRDEFLTLRVDEIRPPEDRARMIAAARTVPDGPVGVWRHSTKNGRLLDVEVTCHVIQFGGRPAALSHLCDVTERRALEHRLQHLAAHDHLTSLINRDALLEELDAAARTTGGVLLVVEVDHLADVNAGHGHDAGDAVLLATADRLMAAIRPADAAACLGGSEFGVLLRGVLDCSEITLTSRSIVAAVAQPVAIAGGEVAVTATVGWTRVSGSGPRVGVETLRDARSAATTARSEGRGRVAAFDMSMGKDRGAAVRLEADLRRAVERGDLRVLYQPIADASSLKVIAVEALVRWYHPQLGAMTPDRFIGLAEEMGAIEEIDALVLDMSARQLALWHDLGLRLRLGVNVSGRDLEDPAFVDRITTVTSRAGIRPADVELELTETIAVARAQDVRPVLSALRDIGFGLALDDFGTGYSILSRLRDFPCSSLKIDRSFVRAIGGGRVGPIVRSIVDMGHALGLRIVGEGVETVAQLDALRACGCDEVQGFMVGLPVEAAVITARLTAATERTLVRSA